MLKDLHKIAEEIIDLSKRISKINVDYLLSEFFFFCTFANNQPALEYISRIYNTRSTVKFPLIALARRIIHDYKIYVKWVLFKNYYKSSVKSQNIFLGELNSDTDTLILSWAYSEAALNNDALNNSNFYMDNLGGIMISKQKRIQHVIVPVFNHSRETLRAASIEKDIMIICLDDFKYNYSYLFLPFLMFFKIKIGSLKLHEYLSLIFSFSNKRYFLSLLIYRYYSDLFSKSKIKQLFLPWENQPEQRAIIRAARENNIIVIGYIHTVVIPTYCHLINDLSIYSPNYVLYHGNAYLPILEAFGWKDTCFAIRSLRNKTSKGKIEFSGKVFLPYDVDDTIYFLKRLISLMNANKISAREIRIHPINKNNQYINMLSSEIKLKSDSEVVTICGFTSVLFESLQAGCTNYNIVRGGLNSKIMYSCFKKLIINEIEKDVLLLAQKEELDSYFYIYDEKYSVSKILDALH